MIADSNDRVVNLDALTYAGDLATVAAVADHPRYAFVHGDIRDRMTVRGIFESFRPDSVVHLAAESHVDRSIDGPDAFVETNVVGTFVMLEEARRHWSALSSADRARFRFIHVSTDEVFGSLDGDGVFDPDSPYRPTSPYAASKAAADHFARAWSHTYGLPVIVTNCTNNYGPYQYPEKLIPVMVANALARRALPVYGRGENVRDWLHVEDHAAALRCVLATGQPGATYLIGARNEVRNLDLVRAICDLVDERHPESGAPRRDSLITFVTDRPGHDHRYALDPSRIERELGWMPRRGFADGLRATVGWLLANPEWGARAGGLGERRGLAVGQ
jgi:dTDP-glucose 4,6-dehydratase